MTLREELVLLLEERTLSHRERRRQRLKRVRPGVVLSAVTKAWNATMTKRESVHGGPVYTGKVEPLTRDEWIAVHFGWIPEEREQMIQFFISKGHHSRCRNCSRGIVSNGPHARCPACGSLGGAPQATPDREAQT